MVKDYHDYIIKNGKFIGRFEEMYQKVDDPWCQGKATKTPYDMVLYLIKKYKICSTGGKVFDVGCGKGAFTYRVRKLIDKAHILAVDISPTAIKKAKAEYGKNIDFKVMDISKNYVNISGNLDLVIISDVMWYLLPNFSKIVNSLKDKIKKNGYLIIKQTFYKPGEQKYGNKIISCAEELLSKLKYTPLEIIEVNRFTNNSTIILFKNER